MIKRTILITALCFSLTAGTGQAFAKDVKFEVSLDKAKIALGERAQLGLSFYGTQTMPAPDLGNIDGLEVRYIGPSTMMTVINGQVSSSITHMYSILPLKIGKFQLGSYTFTYKGNKYASNTAYLEVTEERLIQEERAAKPAEEQLELGDRIFLTLNVDKATAYVNELIPVTVKLYVNRLNVNDIQLPTFEQEGFSKIEFKEPKQYRERSGGVLYDVLEFKTNIFGTKPGDYKLGPAKIKCNIMVKKRSPRPSSARDDLFGEDPFRDSFFDDFFTRYERYPIELKSQDSRLIISPLPTEGAPKSFSGAVGDYQFIFKASPLKVKVGDPVTLQMDINGMGNLNTVLVPKIEDTAGFKVYEPQVKTGENRKTFTQVLIPETDKVSQIPKATFSYFNPNSRQYNEISQGLTPIQVEKGKDEAPAQIVGPAPAPRVPIPEREELARDIIYIKDSPGIWLRKGRQIYRNRIFRVFVASPLFLLAGLYVFRKRQKRMQTDSVYAGRVTALTGARKSFKTLRHQLKGDPRVFYETLFDALQNYLGNRLNVPPAGITADIADSILTAKDVDFDILRKVRNLFATCDRARFALTQIENHKMRDDIAELEEIIRYFERNKL